MLQEFFSTITPQYWLFWIGLVLVVIVLVGRERMHRWALWLPNLVIRQIRRTQGRRRRSRKRRAMTIALETRGLEKSFGGLQVTRDLSLQVEQGARHALIGPNGAGKTTVINLLTGVLKPECRADPARRQRHHRSAGSHAGAARAVAHLPDQPALCRSDPARDRRPCGVRTARPRRRLVAADGHARRRQSTRSRKRWRAFTCST